MGRETMSEDARDVAEEWADKARERAEEARETAEGWTETVREKVDEARDFVEELATYHDLAGDPDVEPIDPGDRE